ncbi:MULTISPECIES: hypothetical protein [unclassified Kribbella]|uniref:hypothetical protein n=1 Tax=unclassified Kribbella TaxID=2644121 RepID=UPI0033E343CA
MEKFREGEKLRKRVWVQNVAVNATVLEAKLRAIRARQSGDTTVDELLDGAEELIRRAKDAAYRDNPIPTRVGNWVRGTLIEAAYQNLHAAEAILAAHYSSEEVEAEIPEAVGRVEVSLHRDDLRRRDARRILTMPPESDRAVLLSKLIEIGYAAADRQHSRLRSFRNMILLSAIILGVFVGLFVLAVAMNPTAVPLCFQPDADGPQYCPTGGQPSSDDVLVVALLGLLGAAIAASLAIRKVTGTSTPYHVPIALAVLKVPFGVVTAIAGLIAIRGEFVPGLSALDSQAQVLAYALLFGYAQQLFTGLIDHQAEAVLARVPGKSAVVARPEAPAQALPRPETHARPAAGTVEG